MLRDAPYGGSRDRDPRDYAHYRKEEDKLPRESDSRRQHPPTLTRGEPSARDHRVGASPPGGSRDYDPMRLQQPLPQDYPRDSRACRSTRRDAGAIPGGSRREQARSFERRPGEPDGFIPGVFGTRMGEPRGAGLARWHAWMGAGSGLDEPRQGFRGGERRPERFDERGRDVGDRGRS